MHKLFSLVAAFAVLSACDVAPPKIEASNSGSADLDTCAVSSAPTCRFRNSPVQVERREVRLPGRKLPFYPTAEELEFVDASRRSWVAPPRTLTDGASIPRVFVSVIGNPTSPEFANAAAIHDAYCGVGNEGGAMFQGAEWRLVHRMFYDALRVGGTPEIKAKIMFAAVYIAGPRWDEIRRETDSVARDASAGWGVLAGWNGGKPRWDAPATAQGNAGVSPTVLRQVLRATIGFIEAKNPGLLEIEAFAEARLSRVKRQVQAPGEVDNGRGPTGENADPAASDPAASGPAVGGPATGVSTAPAVGGTPALN